MYSQFKKLWISSYSYTTLGCYSSMQITVVIVLNLALLFFALNKPIDDFKNMQLLFTYTWHSHHSPATLLWKIWIQHTGKHVQHTRTIMKIMLHVFTSWLSGRDHFWLGCEVDIFNSLRILTLLWRDRNWNFIWRTLIFRYKGNLSLQDHRCVHIPNWICNIFFFFKEKKKVTFIRVR